jgi:electron transfer flavoprotein beta subunit
MANIIVCVKQVLDPEAPVSTYQIDTEARRVIQRGVPPVLSSFDENALEAALRIKDSQKSRITVLTLGSDLSRALAQRALASGADQVIFLEDISYEEIDNYATAFILSAAIRRIEKFDLILTGRQAADTNAGIVGSGIAEILGIPCVTLVRKVELNNDKICMERVVPDGYETVESALPALITVSNELGELRSVSVKGLLAARKKVVTIWKVSRLGIQPDRLNRIRLVKVYIPRNEVKCQLIDGETEEEAGKNLALKLNKTGLI